MTFFNALCKRRSRGFTLVELLVVVGLISVLVAILLPVAQTVRSQARQVASNANLAQLGQAWLHYATENRGCVLPGYTPATLEGSPVVSFDPGSQVELTGTRARRYVWRLAQVVPQVGRLVSAYDPELALPRLGDPEAANNAGWISVYPAYGINSVFVGGHASSLFQGFDGDKPNHAGPAIFKLSKIRYSADQIVFVETIVPFGLSSSARPGAGYHFVMPPRFAGVRWSVQRGLAVPQMSGLMGLPASRNGKRIGVAFADGHVQAMRASELTDMRLWSPKATRPDWDFAN